jgi:hypothetical protein
MHRASPQSRVGARRPIQRVALPMRLPSPPFGSSNDGAGRHAAKVFCRHRSSGMCCQCVTMRARFHCREGIVAVLARGGWRWCDGGFWRSLQFSFGSPAAVSALGHVQFPTITRPQRKAVIFIDSALKHDRRARAVSRKQPKTAPNRSLGHFIRRRARRRGPPQWTGFLACATNRP